MPVDSIEMKLKNIICFLQILRHKVSELEASNAELHQELHKCQTTCDHLAQRAIDAQVIYFTQYI